MCACVWLAHSLVDVSVPWPSSALTCSLLPALAETVHNKHTQNVAYHINYFIFYFIFYYDFLLLNNFFHFQYTQYIYRALHSVHLLLLLVLDAGGFSRLLPLPLQRGQEPSLTALPLECRRCLQYMNTRTLYIYNYYILLYIYVYIHYTYMYNICRSSSKRFDLASFPGSSLRMK